MGTMDLQNLGHTGKDGVAIRTVSSVLLLAATALLVGSLIMAHSVNPSPNSGRVTIGQSI